MDQQLKTDFPVDWVDDNYVSRRDLFKFLTLVSGALAVGSAGMAFVGRSDRETLNFDRQLIGKVSDLPVGASQTFTYPRQEDLCLLIHLSQGQFVAYSRRCTHLSCPVDYQAQNNRIFCPCHNGAFNEETGAVLQGPPRRPLPKIVLEVRGDEIYATGVTTRSEIEL